MLNMILWVSRRLNLGHLYRSRQNSWNRRRESIPVESQLFLALECDRFFL